jgi:hypothetical protein
MGLLAISATGGAADAADGDEAAERKLDRDCVLASGMTEAEADCWELAAKLAGKFFELPEMHPMDKQEVATAIHVIQYKLLSRPTYRKYKEMHKKLPENRK